jgi:hypothetical protein
MNYMNYMKVILLLMGTIITSSIIILNDAIEATKDIKKT